MSGPAFCKELQGNLSSIFSTGRLAKAEEVFGWFEFVRQLRRPSHCTAVMPRSAFCRRWLKKSEPKRDFHL
jgi:hypothetical protein